MLGNEVRVEGRGKKKTLVGAWQLDSKIPEPVCVLLTQSFWKVGIWEIGVEGHFGLGQS